MAIEALMRVRETEEKADSIRREASTRAARILRDARERIRARIEEAVKAAEEKSEALIRRKEEEARLGAEKFVEENLREIETWVAAKREGKPRAVKLIVERIVGYGDSRDA